MNLSGRNMEAFDHVKKNLRLVSEEEEAKLRASCHCTWLSMSNSTYLCRLRLI